MHCGYGTAWGAARGLIGTAGLPPAAAWAAHLTVVRGSELVMLPALDIASPVRERCAAEVAVDGFHHLVHTAATSAAYRLLEAGR